MSYAIPQDILGRYDARVLGDLVTDIGVQVSPLSLLTNKVLQTCLDDASGIVDSAVLVSQRYTPSDLTGLTGVDAAFLIRIVCDLAYVLLYQRRGKEDYAKLAQHQRSEEVLERLRQGVAVFNVAGALEADFAQTSFMTAVQYEALNDEVTYASRLFPVRREMNLP